mmetsp:Transcript_22840/g.58171  ORF Transcript_22840/g.58171 Transcript_22840/m.58171 type:complete len:251 (-) Transcript_22840:1200-1952(-)
MARNSGSASGEDTATKKARMASTTAGMDSAGSDAGPGAAASPACGLAPRCCWYRCRRSRISARPHAARMRPTSPPTSALMWPSTTSASCLMRPAALGRCTSADVAAARQLMRYTCRADGSMRACPSSTRVGASGLSASALRSHASTSGSSSAPSTGPRSSTPPALPPGPLPAALSMADSCALTTSSSPWMASATCGGTDRSLGGAGALRTSLSPRARICSKNTRCAMSRQARSTCVSCAPGPMARVMRPR